MAHGFPAAVLASVQRLLVEGLFRLSPSYGRGIRGPTLAFPWLGLGLTGVSSIERNEDDFQQAIFFRAGAHVWLMRLTFHWK